MRITPHFDKYLSAWYLEHLTVIKRNVLLCLIGTLRHDDCDGARQSGDHLAPEKHYYCHWLKRGIELNIIKVLMTHVILNTCTLSFGKYIQ